jgi:hypothetical protein
MSSSIQSTRRETWCSPLCSFVLTMLAITLLTSYGSDNGHLTVEIFVAPCGVAAARIHADARHPCHTSVNYSLHYKDSYILTTPKVVLSAVFQNLVQGKSHR